MALLGGRASNCSTEDNPPLAPQLAKPGDLTIIQEKYTSITPVKLAEDAHTDNRYGRFAHNDLLNRPLGSRWHSAVQTSAAQQCAGFVHALAPTPDLWSLAMRHRTQIVYPHDAAIIALHLDLRPGSVLVECGTGSGSATAHFARVVAPEGCVHTFEFHLERAKLAKEELAALVGDIAKVNAGIDITKQGFVGISDGEADAVFLDVPAPYVMGDELRRVLKPNGTVCLFSPCLEQVSRSVEMLREGFHSVKTVTARLRTYETREQILDTPGFGTEESREPDAKRRKVMITEKEMKRRNRTVGAERLAVSAMGQGKHEGRVVRAGVRVHSKPFSNMKGHTSFLTFARRCLSSVEKKDDGRSRQRESCTLS